MTFSVPHFLPRLPSEKQWESKVKLTASWVWRDGPALKMRPKFEVNAVRFGTSKFTLLNRLLRARAGTRFSKVIMVFVVRLTCQSLAADNPDWPEGSKMLLQIPQVLKPEQVTRARQLLAKAKWVDGRTTAGYQAARGKKNMQLSQDDPVARELGDVIIKALQQAPLFVAAALPLRIFPPLFNRYEEGHSFGTHVDGAIRQVPQIPIRLRTDLSATVFFSDPAEYDGGELVIEDTFGTHPVKLQPGDMILYPASSLHHVKPITRGTRMASFFWIQSMVRGDAERAMLYELDTVIQNLAREVPDNPAGVQLTNVYHNLLRRWAEL